MEAGHSETGQGPFAPIKKGLKSMFSFGDRCCEEYFRAVLQEPLLAKSGGVKNLIQIETHRLVRYPGCLGN